MKQQYITGTKALAEFLGMSHPSCRKAVMLGQIPKRKLGRRTIFKISEVEEVISKPQ